jgi:hypothetical protein
MQSKISELIKLLQHAQERFGDTDVTYEGLWSVGNTNDPNDYIYIEMVDRVKHDLQKCETADLRRQIERLKKQLSELNLDTGWGGFDKDFDGSYQW